MQIVGLHTSTNWKQGVSNNFPNNQMIWTHVFIAHIQELVELNATVRKGTECPLLLEVGGDLRVGNGGVSLQHSSSIFPLLDPALNIPSSSLLDAVGNVENVRKSISGGVPNQFVA